MEKLTFNNCYDELVVRASPRGQSTYAEWVDRQGYEDVVKFVKEFSHSYLFTISSAEIENVISRSQHALGNIRATESLSLIENFTTPFAFQHLFHWYIEYYHSVPTWEEFGHSIIYGEVADCWYQPLKEFIKIRGVNFTKEQLSRAVKWRLGKVYMSGIRELDLMVRVREAGIPLRYHILADVLLRIDFWHKNVLVCIYFSNPFYKSRAQGRKVAARKLFPVGGSGFKILDVEIPRCGYGNIWLAQRSSITDLVREIEKAT